MQDLSKPEYCIRRLGKQPTERCHDESSYQAIDGATDDIHGIMEPHIHPSQSNQRRHGECSNEKAAGHKKYGTT